MNISEFKKGQEIVRVERVVYPSGAIDRGYMGEKMVFIGISNSNIYLKCEDTPINRSIHDDLTLILRCDVWSDGWSCWENPPTLDVFESGMNHIYEFLVEAKKREDYELLHKVKKLLNDI